MNKSKRLFLTYGCVVFFPISTLRGAVPPVQLTPSELAWAKVAQAAESDLLSDQTLGLMDAYFKKYSDDPKAERLRYMYAERHFRLGQYQKATVGYEKFLQLFPKHTLSDSALYRLGESYYNLKVFNSAMAVWNRLLKEIPNSALVPNAMEQVVYLHMRAGEWGKADELLKGIKTKFPSYAKSSRVREAHGIVMYRLGDFAATVASLDGVDSERAPFYRGLALFSLRLYEDAVASLKEFGNDKPGEFSEAAAFLKAESFFQKNNTTIASAEFAAFGKKYPTSPFAVQAELRRGACALFVRDFFQAIESADRVLKNKPVGGLEAYALFTKASAHLESKNYKDAISLFGRVATIKETPELQAPALLRKAWAHKNLGEEIHVQETLHTLKEQHPTHSQMPLALYLQGAQFYEKGKWEEAGTRFEEAVHGFAYSVISESALALMTQSYDKAGRRDRLVTSANATLKLFEKNFSTESLYWRAQSYFFIAKAYEEMDRYSEAIPFYEKVVTQFADHPLAPHAQLRLGWCLALTGKSDKARASAKIITESKGVAEPLVSNAAFLYATTYFNTKDYNQALLQFADFLKVYPKNSLAPRARYLMGLSYYQTKVLGSAIDEWNKLIQEHPDHPLSQDAYLQVGDLYFKAGEFDKASASFAKFREKWPTSKYGEQAFWQELQAHFNGKADEAAIKIYPVYLEKYSTSSNAETAKKQLEMVYYRRGSFGDPAKLEEFLAKYPKSPFAPSARFKLGDMALEQQKWNRAAIEMEQFVRDYPKDSLMGDALYGLGIAYENQNEVEKAVMQYRNLMTQYADKKGAVDAAFRLGSLHFKKERYQEAADAFGFALKKKLSDDVRVNVASNLALCYENLGRYPEAALAYDTVAKTTKDKQQARESLMNAALLLKKAEQPAKAAPYFEALLKDPGDSKTELQAINFLAECYKATGKEADAIRTYEKLIAVEPPSSDLRLAGLAQLAYLYEQKKVFDKAIRVYEKIAISEGKQEWVKAAQERIEHLSSAAQSMP